ncbi:MAG: hypothetical protein OHK0036_02150 [Bacteroidia bacterium]
MTKPSLSSPLPPKADLPRADRNILLRSKQKIYLTKEAKKGDEKLLFNSKAVGNIFVIIGYNVIEN